MAFSLELTAVRAHVCVSPRGFSSLLSHVDADVSETPPVKLSNVSTFSTKASEVLQKVEGFGGGPEGGFAL